MLFDSYRLGSLTLPNRVVMAPMTRCRAIGNVVNDLVVTYYSQRATAGLIVTEGTSPNADGLGYARMPGLFTPAQAAAWRKVTDGVHAAGGRIFVQLMHAGRVGHALNLPAGARLVGPSALPAEGAMWTDQAQMQPLAVPEALTDVEIEATLEDFVHSARLAVNVAGFDGVELHGANGYLIEQFTNACSNQRTDRWGGSVENRIRFAVEAARRTVAAIGADRVGFRVSPFGTASGMKPDETTAATHVALARALGEVPLAYLHVITPPVPADTLAAIRSAFGGTVILAAGYDRDRAEQALAAGTGDLVSFGRAFIGNPSLVAKMRAGLPLVEADRSVFFSAYAKGYVDFPA